MNIELTHDTISNEDIDNLIEWLKTYPRLTKGEKTLEFERQFSNIIGTKYSVFVNSGSSANLLMLYALKVLNKLKNNKVVLSSLGWATDLAPIMQLELEPLLIDVNINDLSANLEELEEVFKNDNPSAFLLVSVLGLPPNMTKIKELCEKYDVILLEDVCESLGSMHKEKKLGSFGLMSSFSMYFSHHISTIEGGMVCTDDKDVYDILKMIRSHGWDRDLDVEKQNKLRGEYNTDEFSSLFTFYVPGFNLRSTDLQAFLGINQLKKLDDIVKKRNENYLYYEKKFKENNMWFPNIPKDDFVSNFCIPVITENEEEKSVLIKKLQDNNIGVRPLISGSLGTQPFFADIYGKCNKHYCDIIDKRGFYIPNHTGLNFDDIDKICEILKK